MSAVQNSPGTDPWLELFQRRRAVLGWLIAAPVAFALTALLLRRSELIRYVPLVVAAAFSAGYLRAGRRLGEVDCPQCGGKFFARPVPVAGSAYVNVLASRPRCEHCGIGYLERVQRRAS